MQQPATNESLLCIGFGNMGSALAERWQQGDARRRVTAIDANETVAARARERGYETAECVDALPPEQTFDLCLIAVKPQQFAELGPQLRGLHTRVRCFISILAGITWQTLHEHLGEGATIVRSMPNLPARVGAGATACYAPRRDRITDLAETFFAHHGSCLWLEEEALFDAVTAISGSGPAYGFHLCECLERAAMRLGLPDNIALQLARQTVIGAARLLEESETPASTLRENVTSAGGTTAAALEVLMADGTGLAELLARATEAAARRSRELGG